MTAQDLASLLPLVLIVVVFYFLLIRPARNRQRAMVRMQGQLTPGQEVVTTAGLYATITALDGDVVTLETAPGVQSRWARGAVARILQQDASEDPRDDRGGTAIT